MRNIFLIIALSLSATSFSQTTLVMNDLKYNEGIDTEWSVLYIPQYPEIEGKYLEEDNEWYFNVREDHRLFILRAKKSGIYQVKQVLDDVIVQISSIRID